MKNKKGQIAEGVLVLVAIFIAGEAIYASVVHQSEVASSVGTMEKVSDFYFNLDKNNFLNKQYGKLAIHQAYSEITRKPSVKGDCKSVVLGGLPTLVLNESCNFDDESTKKEFIGIVLKEFEERSGNKKFALKFEGDKIIFSPSDTRSSIYSITEVTSYNVSHRFDSEFSLNYPDLGLAKISSFLNSRRSSCGKNRAEFVNCMVSSDVHGWKISSEDLDLGYTLLILKSEKSYFYSGDFKPVEIRFALEKLS